MRGGRNDKHMMVARHYQPSLKTKAPAEMIRERLTPFFAPDAKRQELTRLRHAGR